MAWPLTPDGRMLYEYVRSAIGLLETGEEKLSQSRELQMGHLTIGASDTVTSQFLLPYLERFHRQYPAIHIQIVSGRSHKVLGLLQSGKVDIAFASTPQESASGDAPLLRHPLRVRGGGGLSLRLRPCLFSGGDRRLPPDPFGRKASSRLYLEKYFPAKWPATEPGDRAGRTEPAGGSGGHRLRGGGVTEEFVHEELSKGRLRKLATLRDPAPSVDLCVLRDVPLTPAAQRFADFVKDSLSQRSRYASELGERQYPRKNQEKLGFFPYCFPRKLGRIGSIWWSTSDL